MANTQKRIIQVKVTAGARTESVEETSPDTLKIRVQTPPERGKANDRVIELLAKHYKVPTSRISLIRGSTSREKRFLISL